jgi:RHS repeat-associated protein
LTYGYTGREIDAESGFNYYRARYYSPEIGRFISEDPIDFAGDDLNLYKYTMNNPVLYNDPTGLFCMERFKDRFKYNYKSTIEATSFVFDSAAFAAEVSFLTGIIVGAFLEAASVEIFSGNMMIDVNKKSSFLSKTRQLWRMYFFFIVGLPGYITWKVLSRFYFKSESFDNHLIMSFIFILFSLLCFILIFTIKCPSCNRFIGLYVGKNSRYNKFFDILLKAENCPACNWPEKSN